MHMCQQGNQVFFQVHLLLVAKNQPAMEILSHSHWGFIGVYKVKKLNEELEEKRNQIYWRF